MNILFDYLGFVDKEHCLYMIRSGFNVNNLIGGLIHHISTKQPLKIKMLCYEYLKSEIGNKKLFPSNVDCEFVFVKNSDISKYFDNWHNYWIGLENINDTNIEQYKAFYLEMIGHFKPDIGFVMGNTLTFKKITNLPTFSYDQCFLDRFPFSATLFCMRNNNHSFYNHYGDLSQLKKVPIEHFDLQWLDDIRNGYANLFHKINPFTNYIQSLRKKFKKIILLPLSLTHGDKAYQEDQVSVAWKNLLHIPSDIGVIVTLHPMLTKSSKKEIEWLKTLHPNVIFEQNINKINFSSQYLLHLVDGIIANGSSLALQAIFFQKPLFCVVKNFILPENVYYSNLNDMHNIIDNHNNSNIFLETDKICYHLLTRVAIPACRYMTYKGYQDIHTSSDKIYDIFIGNYDPTNIVYPSATLINTEKLKQYYRYDIKLKLKYAFVLKRIAKSKFLSNKIIPALRLYFYSLKLLSIPKKIFYKI